MADVDRTPPVPDRLRESVRQALRGRREEWPPLASGEVDVLTRHGVAPLLYATVRAPELRAAAIAAAAGEPLRMQDLRAAIETLAAAGAPALIIKGTALAYDVYASPDLRPRGDTDLLVPASSFGRAREALRAAGYHEQITSGDEHGVRQATFSRTDRLGATHVYDLHWAVVNSPLLGDAIQAGSVTPIPLPKISPSAAGLPRPDALFLACIHRVVHHYDDPRLMWLVDIALLRRAMDRGEHERFWRLAAAHRAVTICIRSVELAEEWLGESGPPAAEFLSRQELVRPEKSAEFLDPDVTYGRVLLANFSALPWRQRVTRLRQLAFPPAEFMRESFPGRSREALPLLYLYRAARGVQRLFRRERGT